MLFLAKLVNDEAKFCPSGRVNKQSDRFEEPKILFKRTYRFIKKLLPGAQYTLNISLNSSFLPGNAFTINGERYRIMTREILKAKFLILVSGWCYTLE